MKPIANKEKRDRRGSFETMMSFACFMLSLVILLSSVTYSWLRRSWSSSIREDQLKIEASGSLAFQLDSSKSEYTSTISLLTQIGASDFTLKPVSNLTGKSEDFFYLNKDVVGSEYYAHIAKGATAKIRMDTGVTHGYVEFSFTILGEAVKQGSTASTTKWIYFDFTTSENSTVPRTYLEAYDSEDAASLQALRAVRISITTRNQSSSASSGESTKLFRKENSDGTVTTHYAVNNVKAANGDYMANGSPYYTQEGDGGAGGVAQYLTYNGAATTELSVVPNTEVYQLSDFSGETLTDEHGNYIDESKCLCGFSSNESEDIVVRIWIEGEDPDCVDAISGSQIKLLLSFAAVSCEYRNGHYYIVEHTAS